MVVKIGRREYTQRLVGIALGVRELVRTGYGESGCGGGSVVGGLGVVLISTAAGMYDVRQLQLGSAAGSSPGGLSSPTGCCRFVVNFFQDDIVAVECKSLNARELSGCWWSYFPTNDMISH